VLVSFRHASRRACQVLVGQPSGYRGGVALAPRRRERCAGNRTAWGPLG
jgi:hypothetical protein